MNGTFTRRSILRAGAAGAALVAGHGLLSACGGGEAQTAPSTPTGAPIKGGKLRVGLTGGGPTESLDPHLQLLSPDLVRAFALYSYFGEHDGNSEPNPLLAESVEMVDSTAQVWDIRLRQGLEFHNGKTVTADDVLFSLGRMLDPELQSSAPLLLPWVNRDEMKKVDDRTVRVSLDKPVSIFDQALFNFLSTIVPVDFDAQNPVGAGPFKFKSFAAGDRSVFTRFDNYFDEPAHADELEVISFSDDTALINALLAEEIDIAGSLSASSASVAEQGGRKVVVTPSMGWQPLTMRMDVAPFDDPRIREAFRLIAGRPEMVQQVFSGRGAPRSDLYGWDSGGYPTDVGERTQDLDTARALLEEAGLADMTIDLPTTAAFPGQVEICQVFAEQAKGAGVTVNVDNLPPDIFYTQHYLSAPFASDTFVNVPYLNNTLQCQLPTSPYNASYWSDDEFNSLYDEALATIDETARNGVVDKMQRIQYERGALLIATSFDGLDATRAGVHGLNSGERWAYPLNGYHLERVWLT